MDGWFELHGKFGKLPMKELLAPAIAYARNGFPVTEVIAEGWARNARNLQKYPGFAETYMPNGRAPAKGEMFRNPLSRRTRSPRSPKAAGTRSTRATSPNASKPTCAPTAAT